MYLDDTVYHVYNRGAHRYRIFFTPRNYLYCLELLQELRVRYSVSILAYCLMPNHYHLMLRQSAGGSIARLIQTTFNGYVQAVNKQESHFGTLFESKAKRKSSDDPASLARYIHLNPVHAGLSQSPEDWPFSDYGEWAGIKAPSMTDLALRDELFESGAEYRDFVREFQMEDDLPKVIAFGR